MTKQEEIREGIKNIWCQDCLYHSTLEICLPCETRIDIILNYLHSQGVVRKIESAKPPIVFSEKFIIDSKQLAMVVEKVSDTYDRAGYVAVEALIKE